MLYIMRHGQTDWNVLHKLQGRTDIPLNDAGRAMAEQARERYREVPLDICFCSPLRRAKETAEIFLRDRKIPLVTDERLREMSFGICEGMLNPRYTDSESPVSVLFRHPEAYHCPPEGAESFDELFARTGEFLREAAGPLMDQGKNVLIVGHGAMNLSIISRIQKLPIAEFWSPRINNCELMRLI